VRLFLGWGILSIVLEQHLTYLELTTGSITRLHVPRWIIAPPQVTMLSDESKAKAVWIYEVSVGELKTCHHVSRGLDNSLILKHGSLLIFGDKE
jgi:hypothetical protein